MPGILFLFVAGANLYLILIASIPKNYQLDPIIDKVLDSMSLEISICFFVFAYILGSVFYRKDLKELDEKSAKKIWKKTPVKDRNSLAVQQLSDGSYNVEYPYLHIYEYLHARGYTHLAQHIKWQGNKESTHRFRSKMFINILKARINYFRPNSMSEIIKNEAHIRLMSSLWHCVKWLLFILHTVFFTSVICFFLLKITNRVYLTPLPLIIFNGSLILLFYCIRSSIIHFFHYQRVREILIVLETADIISLENNRIFQFSSTNRNKK